MDNNRIKENVMARIAMSEFISKNVSYNYSSKFKKLVTAACLVLVLSTGVVFAKEIEVFFKNLFFNSNEAIQSAVEEGYVQKENSEYVYSNDIGVKVDSLVLDNLNLNISYLFETKKENVKSIRFNNFIISNDNNKVIYRSEFKSENDVNNVPLYSSFNWKRYPVKISDTSFADSMLIGLSDRTESFNTLYFDIKSINITYLENESERVETIEGNWAFSVEITEEMKRDTSIYYELEAENEYISNVKAQVSPTGMVLEVDLKEPIPKGMHAWPYYFVVKCNGKTYESYGLERSDIHAKISFDDIGIFMDTYDEFEFSILFFDTTVKLVRK